MNASKVEARKRNSDFASFGKVLDDLDSVKGTSGNADASAALAASRPLPAKTEPSAGVEPDPKRNRTSEDMMAAMIKQQKIMQQQQQ